MCISQFGIGDIMPKRITLNDEEYWKLLELKAKYKTESLIAIFDKLAEQPNNQIGITANNHIAPNDKPQNQKGNMVIGQEGNVPLCLCGHPEPYHAEDGCMGDGGLCDCKQHQEST